MRDGYILGNRGRCNLTSVDKDLVRRRDKLKPTARTFVPVAVVCTRMMGNALR